MDPDPQPAQTSRKRRAHKRSRNGCLTCKQRHIRCDELKPVCTNCLTRGGECGYAAESGPSGSGKGVEQHSSKRSIPIIPSSPADPFDSLPIKMPHKSLELFHHFAHYRIFTRTAVPKNPNSQCVGIAFSNPGTFRACLIMAALHYSWIAGPDVLQTGEMEETYLLHKLEAMRLVNEQLADPVRCTSDSCLSLIAALALAESGMGDSLAAQAHLNGLFTLIDMRRPEEWQHRFYGMLQRVILMAGSFVAASKPLTSSPSPSPTSPTTRHPSNLLSTVPLATRLSPFYLTSTPGMEACKADVEGEVLINALTRLTSICYPPSSPDGLTLHPHDPATTAALLKDTDAYVASLLFKPHSLFDDDAPNVQKSFSPDPYRRLPTTLYPSGSRAWATASWLYLHFVLRDLRDQYVEQNENIDPHLLRLLLDTLKADVEATEAAMQAGTYSVEIWGWKVAVGLYVLHVLDEEQDMSVYVESPLDGAIGSDEDDVQMSDVHRVYGSAYSESSDTSSGSDSEEEIGFTGRALRTEGAYIESMKVYFTEKLSIWTHTAKLEDQQAARQLLRKILWPPEDQFDGDAILETVCWNTGGAYSVSESEEGGYETQGSPVIPVDPLIWG